MNGGLVRRVFAVALAVSVAAVAWGPCATARVTDQAMGCCPADRAACALALSAPSCCLVQAPATDPVKPLVPAVVSTITIAAPAAPDVVVSLRAGFGSSQPLDISPPSPALVRLSVLRV